MASANVSYPFPPSINQHGIVGWTLALETVPPLSKLYEPDMIISAPASLGTV